MLPTIRVIRAGFPETPGLDTSVSRAMLIRASAGLLEESFRLHVPGRVVAFGKRDIVEKGYEKAVAAARELGFEAVERLAGGRAAVFHEGTLAFNWTVPTADPRSGITRRFETISGIIVEALTDVGADARIGEITGEYCPGQWSVNIGDRVKVAGIGQRLARAAAHVGGVVVVDSPGLVNRALEPVYRELKQAWDPRVTGAVSSEVSEATLTSVGDAIMKSVERRWSTRDARLDDATMAEAIRLAPDHVAPS